MAGTLRPEELLTPSENEGVTVPQIGAPIPPSALELESSDLDPDSSGTDRPTAPVAPAQKNATPLLGSLISGRYRVHELIGIGGMGAVYRGEQVHLRKRVAIKLLRPNTRRLPELVARFEREAVAGAHIQHPNVVSAIDFGQLEDKSYFLVLEYVEGTPLKSLIQEGPLPAARALTIARQLALALQAAHSKGILHRDLKPMNVLLDREGQVKLIDFGLAKVDVDQLSSETRTTITSTPALTVAGEIFGTLAYLAPEAIRGMEAVDARGDLYALGIVLYEMLAGRHPFDSKDAVALFKQHHSEGAPPFHERAPEVTVHPEVERVVLKLIQRDPDHRYASATEVIAALDEALIAIERPAEPPAQAPDVSPAPPSVHSTTARRLPLPLKTRWAPVAAVAAALTLIVITFALSRRGATPGGLPRSSGAAASEPGLAASLDPSASPTPSAPTSAPTEIDGLDALGWRGQLGQANANKQWIPGAQAVLALARLDLKLLMSKALREEVVSAIAGIGYEKDNALADQVFKMLANDIGSDGLDLLFDLVRARGGTRSAQRATDLLARPEVIARASPALRVLIDFRKAPCEGKRALFERAAAEGDDRLLYELKILYGTRCKNKNDSCCFHDEKALKDVLEQMKTRLNL